MPLPVEHSRSLQRAGGTLDAKTLPDRVFTRPELSRHSLIHYSYQSRRIVIGVGEGPTLQERYSHALKIGWVDAIGRDVSGLLVWSKGMGLNISRAPARGNFHGHRGSKAGELHSGQLPLCAP